MRATESHGPPDTGVSADLRSLHSGVGLGDLSEPRHGYNGHTEAQHSRLFTEKLQPGPLSLTEEPDILPAAGDSAATQDRMEISGGTENKRLTVPGSSCPGHTQATLPAGRLTWPFQRQEAEGDLASGTLPAP